MKGLFFYSLFLISFSLIGKDKAGEESIFLQDLQKQASMQNQSGCKKCISPKSDGGSLENDLRVYMSFSVPIETWKDLSASLEKIGGSFVIRGLPENSFEVFSEKVLFLRKSGVNASILIDPEAFDRYAIQSVPAFVLTEGDKHDKLSGNVPLETVLKDFSERGNLSKKAGQLLAKYNETGNRR